MNMLTANSELFLPQQMKTKIPFCSIGLFGGSGAQAFQPERQCLACSARGSQL
jgi:hypothetical protein